MKIYHGETTRAYSYQIGENNPRENTHSMLSLSGIEEGEKVCFVVENANTIFYNYSLKSKTTSDSQINKEFASFNSDVLKLIGELFKGESFDLSAKVMDIPSGNDEFVDKMNQLISEIDTLVMDLKAAKLYRLDSDTPLSLEEVKGGRTNLRQMKDLIDALPQDVGRFNSPSLNDYFQSLVEEVKGVEPGGIYEQTITVALENYVELLLNQVEALKLEFGETRTPVKFCEVIGANEMNFTLSISPRDANAPNGRQSGDLVLTANVFPNYPRNTFEVSTLLYVLHSAEAREFRLVDGIVKGDQATTTRVRPGSMLIWNVTRFGKRKEGALGFGPGVGLTNDGKRVLTDFLFGIVASHRNNFRIGLGVGFAELPNGLKEGIEEDLALPEMFANSDLDDLVRTERKIGFYFTITLPGLKFGGKE